MDQQYRIENRDGMTIEWDAPIPMDDGVVLRADVFRPSRDGKYPVILSYGPYAKGLSLPGGLPAAGRIVRPAPRSRRARHNKYQNWELVDPERWVPDGYVLRAGRLPRRRPLAGLARIWSAREAQDISQCIEWAGTQPGATARSACNGISYYAMNQWQVAALQPKHLAALCSGRDRRLLSRASPATAASCPTSSPTGTPCR